MFYFFKRAFLLVILFLFTFILGGCDFQLGIGGGNKKNQAPAQDAGVYGSTDQGIIWAHIKTIPSASGQPGNLGKLSILTITIDPQDTQAIYAGTDGQGIYYSYDGGNTWSQFKNFNKGSVVSIAVDPSSKCIIYASLANKVVKTTDCGRSWDDIYFDTRGSKVTINTVAVDSYNSQIIYAATSHGEIFKSFDRGVSWRTPFSVIKGNIQKLLINYNDTRVLYIATKSKGLYKSVDGANTWQSLNENMKQYKGYNDFRDLDIDLAAKDTLIHTSKFGLLKTTDGGIIWEPIPILTAPGQADIKILAIDPINGNNIYYVTVNTVYKTTNSGEEWVPKKLFSTSIPTDFLINSKSPDIMYMSFKLKPVAK